MGTSMRDLLGSALTSLRYEPTEKRLRIHLDERVRDLVAFFNERVDVIVDGQHRQRPITPFSD
jgi:hypothetical protein